MDHIGLYYGKNRYASRKAKTAAGVLRKYTVQEKHNLPSSRARPVQGIYKLRVLRARVCVCSRGVCAYCVK